MIQFKADIFGFVFGFMGAFFGFTVGTLLTTATAIVSFLIAVFSLLVLIDKHTTIDIPFIHTDKEGKK